MAKLDNGPPRGTRDLLPAAVERRRAITEVIEETYGRFGFRRVETPAIEDVRRLTAGQGGDNEKLLFKILRRGLGDQVASGTRPDDLCDLALRFDLTVPLSRLFAHNQSELPTPFRALQIGPVWRAERPARGRYRQFTQCDIDTIGEPSVLAECELVEATTTALLALGVAPIAVRVNDRRLLAALADRAGAGPYLVAGYFIALDKLERIGWEGVSEELAERGFHEDVAKSSRELAEELAATRLEALGETASRLLPELAPEVVADLEATGRALATAEEHGVEIAHVLDPVLARGMGYYTGQIFEIMHPACEGSIAGGGRYDNLVGRSLGRAVPACGISIGFERVVDLARVRKADLGVALLYGDESPATVLATADRLRADGSKVAVVPRRKALKAQLGALAEEGYRSFVLLEGGELGDVRPLERSGGAPRTAASASPST